MFGRSEVEAGRQMVDNGELGYYCSNYFLKLKFKVGHFYKLIKKSCVISINLPSETKHTAL